MVQSNLKVMQSFCLLVLATVMCTTAGQATAQEDYRWRMLGENGEEFIMTILGAVPHIGEDDSTGYSVTGFDLQFNLPFDPVQGTPYQVVPQFDSYIPPSGGGNRFSLVVEERPDLLFTFSGDANPGYTAYIDDWGNDQAFSLRTYRIEVNNSQAYAGILTSVSRIPIPEPSSICLSVVALFALFSRRPQTG
ncbi:MAG: hypothetical protein R3E01_21360 [Pirellulaceae bacterium]